MKEAFSLGKELNELSARTGIAVGDLVGLREEFQNAGKSAEDIGPVFSKMQRSLAQGTGADLIRKMGIDMRALRGMTPIDQFHTLGKAIANLQNPLDRAQAAMTIFGKSGGELLALFAEHGFSDADAALSNKAQILQRDAGLFADVTNSLRIIGNKVQGFWVGLADRVAPVLKPLLDGLKGLDFSKLGQDLGDAVAFLIQAFADGSIGDILLTTLKIALAEAGNFTLGIFLAVGQALAQLVAEGIKNAVSILQVVTTADFWKGLGNALLSSAQAFIAMMLDGVARVLGALRNVPGIGGKIGKAADSVSAQAQSFHVRAAENSEASGAQLGPLFAAAGQRMKDELANVITAAADGFSDGISAFNTDAMNSELEGMMAKVMNRVKSVSEKSLATSQKIDILDPVIDSQSFTISTVFQNTYAISHPSQYRLVAVPKWTPPQEPTAEDKFMGTAVEPQTDEIKIGTLWMVSPPSPDGGEDAVPDGTWEAYPQYAVFWNLAHASRRQVPKAPPEPITLHTGLAGGMADSIFASLLAPSNDAYAQAMAYLDSTTFKGEFWTI